MEPKVYIVQEQDRFDYSPAEKFGELHFLTIHEYSTNKNSPKNDMIKDDMIRGLREYRPGVDYLVLTGSPILMCLGFHYANMHGNVHKILKWDNQAYEYKIVNVGV
jgi:hypothetical protein